MEDKPVGPRTWAGVLRSEHGATAVEYALMVALLAVVIVSSVTALGLSLDHRYGEVATAIENSPQTQPGPDNNNGSGGGGQGGNNGNNGNGGNSGNTNGWGMGSGGGQGHTSN